MPPRRIARRAVPTPARVLLAGVVLLALACGAAPAGADKGGVPHHAAAGAAAPAALPPGQAKKLARAAAHGHGRAGHGHGHAGHGHAVAHHAVAHHGRALGHAKPHHGHGRAVGHARPAARPHPHPRPHPRPHHRHRPAARASGTGGGNVFARRRASRARAHARHRAVRRAAVRARRRPAAHRPARAVRRRRRAARRIAPAAVAPRSFRRAPADAGMLVAGGQKPGSAAPLAAVAEQPAGHRDQGLTRVVEEIPSWVWYLLAALGGVALGGLLLAAAAARRAHRTEAAAAALRRGALTDPLTGALNRRGFDERLAAELARARRTGRPLAVAYLDVVGLKAVNDRYGHATGDHVLQATARLLEANSRGEDAFARIGGDEWAVILPEQDGEGARTYGRRLLDRLPAAQREPGIDVPWSLTVGWAVHPEDGTDGDALLKAADRRLYARRGIEIA